MVFVPKDNCVQANLRCTLLGQQIENTLYFEKDGIAPTPADMLLLGQELIAWWTGRIQNAVVNDLEFREVYLTDLSANNAPTVTATGGLPLTGAVTDDPLPNNVALCVSFRSNGRGRSSRGRNYVSGFGENTVSGNTVTSVVAENIRLYYAELMDAATFTDPWTWIVYSRYEDGLPRTEALTAPVTAVVLTDTTVDSQRRRLPGRGR